MRTSRRKQDVLGELLALYTERKSAIRARLGEFALIQPHQCFYELLYCLMTPQSSAEHAEKTVALLRHHHFQDTGIDPEPLLRQKPNYIRFHRTKAKHLLRAREEFPAVLQALSDGMTPGRLREWLVKNVEGLGYKEATHFLRNVGMSGGLAILDRHILRNLKRHGVIGSIPPALSKRKYLSIERRFQRFALEIGIPLDELDLLFWSTETGEIRK